MRRRRIIMFFATIMSVAIIAVGFAAWIITSPTDDSINNGSISVETVTLEGWQFETKWVSKATYVPEGNEDTGVVLSGNPKIVFGKPADATNGNVANNSETIENLEAYLYVIAKPIEGTVIKDTATIKLDFLNVQTEQNPLNVIGYSFSNVTTNDNVGTITTKQLQDGVVITISFAWKTPELEYDETSKTVSVKGTVKNENPLTYYNGLSFYNQVVAKKAYDYLKAVNDALSGVSFQVTLEGIPAPATE